MIDLADTPITMSPMEEPIELTNITVVETPTTEAVPFVVAIARQNDGAMGRLVDRAIEFLPWVLVDWHARLLFCCWRPG